MVYKIADNVLSPLGETTAQNYRAVKAGRSALLRYDHWNELEGSFAASLFTTELTCRMAQEGLTRFESLAYASARTAIADCNLDVSQPRAVFILSTTKANIETGDSLPAESAQHISSRLGFTTTPIVVCNACISGVSAIILAQRLLEGGCYDYAVVCGADVQSAFTVAGFMSLKALSAEPCRPFDIDRNGLNLGEAAATIVLSSAHDEELRIKNEESRRVPCWAVVDGAVRNDAFHIIAPSKTAEGACRALEAMGNAEIDFINAHGTGTMFNDQMEAVAVSHSPFARVPVNGLKGYFGHTLGAAGVLETVISMAAADDHTLIGTKGYSEPGTSRALCLCGSHQPTDGRAFVKLISGFGGCNAALRLEKVTQTETARKRPQAHVVSKISVREDVVQLYKEQIGDYPRFYKMDPLSRLGFVASELLLREAGPLTAEARRHCAVVLCNHSSAMATDRHFRSTISDFPSPALFIYTLPNIVTAEIAIRHQLKGETAFYILPQRDDKLTWQLVEATFQDAGIDSIVGGWIDYEDDHHYEADLFLAVRN